MEDQTTEKAGAQHLRFPDLKLFYHADDGVSQRGQQLLPEVRARLNLGWAVGKVKVLLI